jgi:hypothetical protein
MNQIPNLFSSFSKGGKGDFLDIEIWILFVVCYLVLGIFSIQGSTVLRYPSRFF